MKKVLLICTLTSWLCPAFAQQNVGIGTTSPTEKLHVAGNARMDTVKTNGLKLTPGAGAGKVLTSDAAGNASWRTGSVAANSGYGVWGDCATNGNIGNYQPVGDTAQGAGTSFAKALTVSGDFAAIGNWGENIGGNSGQGSVSIYHFNGTSWDFVQKLTDPGGAASDRFGISVSMSGNLLIAGSNTDDVGANASQGSACFFRYNGSSWVFVQKILDPSGAAGDQFGFNLSVSGNFAVIGAYLDDNGTLAPTRGSAIFYRYNGSTWVFMNKAVDPDGATNDYFGSTVSISGDYAVAGARGDDETHLDQGSVTVYKYNGTNAFVRLEKIFDTTPSGGDEFGYSVSNNGSDIVVGSQAYDSYVGKATYYRYINGAYQKAQTFTSAPNEGLGSLLFGKEVFMSGNYLMIGVPGRNIGGENGLGEIVLYQRVGNYYNKMQVIRDPAGTQNVGFGNLVAIDGVSKHFVASNYNNGGTVANARAVFGTLQ
jgi:hypothetical protein